MGRYQRNTCQGETAPNLWGLAANWEAQTWVSLRNSPSVEENLWSAPRPETPDDMGDDTRENLTWIWDRYSQWLGRGNFGRRWYNVLIWSDFGVSVFYFKGVDCVFRVHVKTSWYLCQKWKIIWQLFDCTGQAHSPPLFYPTPWFEAFPALARFERKRAYQLWHAKQAVRNKTHQSYWAKAAWDVRRIMYFYLCCDVSWYSNFRCSALVCWKSSMFKDYCAVAWAWESDSFCISCCFTWSNLNKQRLSIAFPAAIWMMILFSSILM